MKVRACARVVLTLVCLPWGCSCKDGAGLLICAPHRFFFEEWLAATLDLIWLTLQRTASGRQVRVIQPGGPSRAELPIYAGVADEVGAVVR